jgi:hypothetical protein
MFFGVKEIEQLNPKDILKFEWYGFVNLLTKYDFKPLLRSHSILMGPSPLHNLDPPLTLALKIVLDLKQAP